MGDGRPAQRAHQDPRDQGRPAGHHRGASARGHLGQRDADLQPGALRRGHRRLPRRPRAGQGRRPRPVEDPLGRLVLRVARRHRGRQAARRAIGTDEAEALKSQGRRRERAPRVRAVRAGVRHRPREGADGCRRQRAAAALGLHRRQGPVAPRHAVRHRARRSRHREHDAREDARGDVRPRRDRRRRRHRRLRRRARASSTSSPPSASTSPTSPRCSRTKASRSSSPPGTTCRTPSTDGARGRARRPAR